MATYNGHKNWSHWNVSLWLNNDEDLYFMVKDIVNNSSTKVDATTRIYNELMEMGVTETPDGAKYTKTAIRAAIVGI